MSAQPRHEHMLEVLSSVPVPVGAKLPIRDIRGGEGGCTLSTAGHTSPGQAGHAVTCVLRLPPHRPHQLDAGGVQSARCVHSGHAAVPVYQPPVLAALHVEALLLTGRHLHQLLLAHAALLHADEGCAPRHASAAQHAANRGKGTPRRAESRSGGLGGGGGGQGHPLASKGPSGWGPPCSTADSVPGWSSTRPRTARCGGVRGTAE
jgi:hypothetical protein